MTDLFSQSSAHVGDLVLIGRPGTTMPSDWFLAKLLWVGDGEVLTEHSDISGSEIFRQVLSTDHIRAVGSVESLREFKQRSRQEVKELQALVRQAEAALGDARAAVWKRLDEIGAAQPEKQMADLEAPAP